MRSLIVYAVVILSGAIVYKVAARAENWVDPAGSSATTTTVSAKAASITGVTLKVYDHRSDKKTGAIGPVELLRTITVKPTSIDIGEKQDTLQGEFALVQAAADSVPGRIRSAGMPQSLPTGGGVVLIVERGAAEAWHVIPRKPWAAGPVDAVKDAIWEVVRKRWKPAYKRRPATEFVEPFQTLRAQLRIRF